MKKVITLFALVIMAGAALATTKDTVYVYQPKDGNEVQFKRDLVQCTYETSQRHRFKDPQKEALVVDCMLVQMGHKLVPKQ